MKIYLAGGMHSGWQDILIDWFDKFTFIDPRSHRLTDPREYTEWDMNGIRTADLVFAYLERSNPSGLGLALEVGYAVGLNRPVFLVDEKRDRYADILRAASHKWFDGFADGLRFLDKMHETYLDLLSSPVKMSLSLDLKEEVRFPTSEGETPPYIDL